MINHAQTEVAGATVAIAAVKTNAAFSEGNAKIEEDQISDSAPDSTENLPSQHGDWQSAPATAQSEENLYECHHLRGGAKHPGRIIETPGLANIKPPRPTHRLLLPAVEMSEMLSELLLT